MIIVDLNQLMYSTVLLNAGDKSDIDHSLVRHITLNSIRAIRTKFKHQYGELVIATDSYKYWRRDYFPYYKANRKKSRENSNFDWPAIFECINLIKSELRESFPYKYIEVVGAEADDIISTLCSTIDEPIMIVSGDKDFCQLQKYDNVKQYDAVHKKFLKVDDPLLYLHEHILKGDVGDGIPNILSPDNCLVLGERQKRMTKNIYNQLVGIELQVDSPHRRNYIRNKTLIDLSMTPEPIKQQIIEQFDKQPISRTNLIDYFIKHKLKTLMENLNEF